jgi:hypothetical protein
LRDLKRDKMKKRKKRKKGKKRKKREGKREGNGIGRCATTPGESVQGSERSGVTGVCRRRGGGEVGGVGAPHTRSHVCGERKKREG